MRSSEAKKGIETPAGAGGDDGGDGDDVGVRSACATSGLGVRDNRRSSLSRRRMFVYRTMYEWLIRATRDCKMCRAEGF